MHKLKKIEVGGVILLVLFVLYAFIDSYGLFESKGTLISNNDVATWNISVNNHSIKTTKSFTIDEVIWNNEGYAKDNTVVPGSSGYFDLIIDPLDTDVSIRYDLSFDFSGIISNDIAVVSIKELLKDRLVKTGLNKYTGVITVAEIKKLEKNTVRVEIAWNNNENSNELDTELSKEPNRTIDIPIDINISQYLGEKITEYAG